jgi:hypothetical protein
MKTQTLFGTETKQPLQAKKCYNCKHRGSPFKLGNVTHQHCEHPKYTREQFESGELSAWDTLNKFSDACNDHES